MAARALTRFFFTLLAGALVMVAGCGREAPFYAPASLTVTSDPPGAVILLNGEDTGEATKPSRRTATS